MKKVLPTSMNNRHLDECQKQCMRQLYFAANHSYTIMSLQQPSHSPTSTPTYNIYTVPIAKQFKTVDGLSNNELNKRVILTLKELSTLLQGDSSIRSYCVSFGLLEHIDKINALIEPEIITNET